MEYITSLKWQLIKNKKKILLVIKSIIVIAIFFTFSLMLFAPYRNVFNFFLYLALFLWLPLSLFYFADTDNKEDRTTILKMWKVYFSIITLMFVFTFSTENYIKKVKIDYFKTKLMYEMKTDANLSTIKDTFKNFEELTIMSVKYLEPQDVNLTKDLHQKKVIQKPYKILYGNLSAGIMAIVTLFMLLWAISELSWFETPKKESKLKRIRLKYNKNNSFK
jgi:hypothetical protein